MAGWAGASNSQVSSQIRLSVQVAKSGPRTLSKWRHGFKSLWDYQRERVANGPPRRSFYPMNYPTVCSKGDSVSLLQESKTPRQGRGSLY
jgi:hypothetical protein